MSGVAERGEQTQPVITRINTPELQSEPKPELFFKALCLHLHPEERILFNRLVSMMSPMQRDALTYLFPKCSLC